MSAPTIAAVTLRLLSAFSAGLVTVYLFDFVKAARARDQLAARLYAVGVALSMAITKGLWLVAAWVTR